MLLSGTAGGVFDGSYNHQKTSPNGYLTTGNHFWTMTPAGGYVPFGNTTWYSYVFIVFTSGSLDDLSPADTFGVRPVINLRSDLTITGDGSKTNPYQVS